MGNREYKSDVFTMLMEIPEYALEIYNVLNGSNYSDPAQVRIMKLEKGILFAFFDLFFCTSGENDP